MLLLQTHVNYRKNSTLNRRKIFPNSNNQSFEGVLGSVGINPSSLANLVDAFLVENIIAYDGNSVNPQVQWISTVNASQLRRTTVAAPNVPAYLEQLAVSGTNFAHIGGDSLGLNQYGVYPPAYADKMLAGCSTFTIIFYLKDTVGINATKNRQIYFSSGGAYPTQPYFRVLILAGATQLYVNANDGAAHPLTINDGNDYRTNGSICVFTFNSATGSLNLYNKWGSYNSTDAAWVPTNFYGGAIATQGIMQLWNGVDYRFDGIMGDVYSYSVVLSNSNINGIAKWYAQKFGLTLSDVWTNI